MRMPKTNPNSLTWLAILFALLGGLCIYLSNLWLMLPAFLFIGLNSYFDALDGKVAKIHGKASVRGDFLDHAGDRYADLFILLGITFSAYCAMWIGVLAIVGVLMTSYMGTQAQALGAGRDYGGILGRAERQVILIIAPLIHFVLGYFEVDLFGYTVFEFVMVWFAIAGNFTAIHRAAKTWDQL